MKKALAVFLLAALLSAGGTVNNAKALTQENFEGNPDENPNHFIWSIFAQLEAPDDPDCHDLALAALSQESLGEHMDPSLIATFACQGIASMKTSMQAEMNGGFGNESVETNLFDAPNWHQVENLYFKHSTNGVPDGKIEFSAPIDFMSYNFMQFMSSFGENMDSEVGEIALDADVVDGFSNYGATLTLYNIPKYKDPVILVNGKTDKEGVVSNIVYDKEANTITFSASHFTSFEVKEKKKIKKLSPKISSLEKTKEGETLTVTINGDNFKDTSSVYLGSKKAKSVNFISSRKMIASFDSSQFKKPTKKMKVTVVNSSKKRVLSKKKISF